MKTILAVIATCDDNIIVKEIKYTGAKSLEIALNTELNKQPKKIDPMTCFAQDEPKILSRARLISLVH